VSGYDFHPEASVDLDEIWEFIAADNLDAADRVIADILAAIGALASAFSAAGLPSTRFDLTPLTLHASAGLPHCVCAE
jgi:plasmid stabilization system protein ParE